MPRISLTLIDDTAYIFNAEDYMKIRCEHRIIGRLVGTSVKWPRNSNVSGLPATYSTYEAQLLIDKGIAVVVKKQFPESISSKTVEMYQEIRNSHHKELTEIYCEKKIAESQKMIDKILAGKRKKVMATGGDVSQVTEDSIIADIRKKYKFNLNNILVQVPTEEVFENDSIEVSHPFPQLNQLKYRIFCDLYEKGKWLSSGETFGGDFLIYPGEPLYFHASHIVHVMNDDEVKQIPINTLIRKQRLSVVVNKFCIFAYVSSQTNEIIYQTVRWEGK